MTENDPHAMTPTRDEQFNVGGGVGDDLDDLGEIAPHVEFERLARGGRIERKPYKNKNGTRRIYYVMRWEEKKDGKRYRPTRYLGKTPAGRVLPAVEESTEPTAEG